MRGRKPDAVAGRHTPEEGFEAQRVTLCRDGDSADKRERHTLLHVRRAVSACVFTQPPRNVAGHTNVDFVVRASQEVDPITRHFRRRAIPRGRFMQAIDATGMNHAAPAGAQPHLKIPAPLGNIAAAERARHHLLLPCEYPIRGDRSAWCQSASRSDQPGREAGVLSPQGEAAAQRLDVPADDRQVRVVGGEALVGLQILQGL